MLIPLVDGESRRQLVCARAQAMRSGCSAGIALLSDDPASDASQVALLMLHCEILYLDHQYDTACTIYDTKIEPLLERLSPECASILADNRTTIAFALFNAEGLDQFYHQVDIRRLLGIELRDSSAELEADRSASAGKHHDALPTIWKLLLNAYRKQNWRALRWAHARMARECIALNWPDDAAWHALQALDKDLLSEAANRLAASRDGKRIATAVDRLLMFSKLAQHAALTAEFLYNIVDCIPDDRVAQLLEWVSAHLDFVPTNRTEYLIFEPIWKLVGRLSLRITPSQALQIAQKATTHGAIAHKSPERKHLIDSWRWLFERISPQYLDQFADPVLSLVTTHKSDFDFVESINLVCQLAQKSASCRDTLRATLFPPGVKVSNPILLEAASFLEWHPQDVDMLNAKAVEIAMALRKQVETLEVAAEPSKLGGFGQVSKTMDTEKIIVHVGGAQHWIDAIAAHLACLNGNSVRQLVQAMLEMIVNDNNIVSNRISLIQSLSKFTPRLPEDIAESTAQIIGNIARGDFRESEIGQTFKEATNPLNPFKMNMGDPRDLRGIALMTLASGSKTHPAFSAELHSGILMDFMEIDDEKLSRFGAAAAKDADQLTESETTALIASSLDGPPKVRQLVLQGLAAVMSVNFDRQGLRLGIRAIRSASDSADATERAAAAKAAKTFLRHAAIDEEMKERITAILKLLSGDISHYVRNCASDIDARE